MKKVFICLIAALLILPTVFALNLKINEISQDEVMIAGVNQPVVFDLNVTNLGTSDNIEFYNLVGFRMFPEGKISIGAGETKEIKLQVTPIEKFDYLGYYTFHYFIKGQSDPQQIDSTLMFKRVTMDEAFAIGASDVNPQSSEVQVFVKNKINFDFGQVTAKLSSSFFNVKETFNLGPKETKNITIQLNKDDFSKLVAGFYNMNAEIQAGSAKTEVETTLNFIEKNIVTEKETKYGWVINTNVIKKTNEGNVVSSSQTIVQKNIVSRLFTTFTPEPDGVQRNGLTITYTWNRDIKPGETLEIDIKTNWLVPFLIVILVIAVVIVAKQYSKTNLVLKKKVSFVKAKGGEFALKVSIYAIAKKRMDNVIIVDKLPPLVKLYDKFGMEKPSRVDEKARRIEWNFDTLAPGEIRALSYIVFSKVGVLGKFALPEATGIYEKNGKMHETESNRAFFVAEQRTRDIEEVEE
jgi:hypothetical protein